MGWVEWFESMNPPMFTTYEELSPRPGSIENCLLKAGDEWICRELLFQCVEVLCFRLKCNDAPSARNERLGK